MDLELIERVRQAQEGDLDAFCYVVTGTRCAALAMARTITTDPHAAEDAVQEAYLLALSRLEQLRAPAAFLGWLQTLVRTAALRQVRKRHPDLCGKLPQAATGRDAATALLEAGEVRAQVRAAIRALTAERQRVVERYYLQGLSVRETALDLGLPEGSVKRLLHEARERLRPRLLGLGGPTPSSLPSSPAARSLRIRL